MVRKSKTSEVNIDDVSYDAIVETVSKEEEKPEEPPTEQKEEPEVTPEIPFEPKPKKEAAKGVCEGCGKEMTLKNLRYAHKFVCAGLNKVEEPLPVPEKPVLVRSESLQPEFKEELKNLNRKRKRKRNLNQIRLL